MRAVTTLVPATLALLAVGAADALARDIQVPAERPTIASALATARRGDRVVVSGGRHEDVQIDRDGVTLLGRGAVLSGTIVVSGSRATLQGFRFAESSRVRITGDDAVFRSNRMGEDSFATLDGGNRALISDNTLSSAGLALVSGADAVVRRNRQPSNAEISARSQGVVLESNRGGRIYVEAAHAVVRGNRAIVITDAGGGALIERNVLDGAIYVTGHGTQVRANRIVQRRGFFGSFAGIEVSGDDASVRGNTIRSGWNCIRAAGARPNLLGNTLAHRVPRRSPDGSPGTDRIAAVVLAGNQPGGVIAGNSILHYGGPGIEAHTDGVSVTANVLHGVSPGASLILRGDEQVASGNEIVQTGAGEPAANGIEVYGDASVLRDNRVAGAAGDGIAILAGDGNLLAVNAIRGARGAGIRVGPAATGTDIDACTVTGCFNGVVNESGGTSMTRSVLRNNTLDVLVLVAFREFKDNVFESIIADAGVDTDTGPDATNAVR
jgi:hypothetical protein